MEFFCIRTILAQCQGQASGNFPLEVNLPATIQTIEPDAYIRERYCMPISCDRGIYSYLPLPKCRSIVKGYSQCICETTALPLYSENALTDTS